MDTSCAEGILPCKFTQDPNHHDPGDLENASSMLTPDHHSENPLESLSDEALMTRLTRLAANVNAATCQLLLIIAEFDNRRGWADEGVRSCAHWLNYQCGIAMGAAREKLRVGHAMTHLPKTQAAFRSGSLSYSKARAITRVATTDNEESLLFLASNASATQVERTVRLYRRQYLDANALKMGPNQVIIPAPAGDPVDEAEAERQGAAHQHDHRKLETSWDEHGVLQIRARLNPEQGAIFLKAVEIAVESLKADRSPDSDAPRHDHDLSSEDHEVDPQQALRRADNRRADALVLLAETFLQNANTTSTTADRFQVVVHVNHDVLTETECQDTPAKCVAHPDCYVENEVGLPAETARRLCCSSKIIAMLDKEGEPMSIGRSSRAIPPAMNRALKRRDGGCRFPGCGAHRYIDAHHIVHWADGGETSMDNLIQLCRHHHGLLHEGGYSMWGSAIDPTFLRRDGSAIKMAPDVQTADDQCPKAAAVISLWCGESLDYSAALPTLHYDTFPRERLQPLTLTPQVSSP